MTRHGSLGASARAYAQKLRWPVFPLKPRGKDPLIPKGRGGKGHLDATTDQRRVALWWRENPGANIGIACYEGSGLLALDVDPRNGGDHDLAALEAEHGKLPHTVEALTGGGGRHILFTRPEGVRFAGKLCDGVDIKANGYIVAPPSVHPSGRIYEWEISSRPLETELAELPPWVLGRILSFRSEYGQPADDCAHSFLARAFAHAGWLGTRIDAVRINVRCPWDDQHTVRSGSGGTVLFAPRQGSAAGWFHCSHTSHGPKTMADVLAALPAEALQKAAADAASRAAEDASYQAAERAAIQTEGAP